MGRVAIDEPGTCELKPEPGAGSAGVCRLAARSEGDFSPACGTTSSVNSMSLRAADFSVPGLRAVGNKSGNPVADDHDFLSDETS